MCASNFCLIYALLLIVWVVLSRQNLVKHSEEAILLMVMGSGKVFLGKSCGYVAKNILCVT